MAPDKDMRTPARADRRKSLPGSIVAAAVKCAASILMGVLYSLAVIVYSGAVMWEGYQTRIVLAGALAAAMLLTLPPLLKRRAPGKSLLSYPLALAVLALLLPVFKIPGEQTFPLALPLWNQEASAALALHDESISSRAAMRMEEMREAVILNVNHVMMREVEIPAGSVARFGVGIEARPGAAPFHLAVFLRPAGEARPRQLYSRLLGRESTRWEDVAIDLADLGAASGKLAIQVTTSVDEKVPDRVFISRLELGPELPPERLAGLPNIILIVVDTLRPDHLNTYGYDARETDPFLMGLWKDRGVRFDMAVSPSSWTTPAVASILTSLHPYENGVNDVQHMAIDANLETLAEALRKGGYKTAAFSMSYLVSPPLNFLQGFDHFFDLSRYSFHWDGDREASGRAAAWLERPGREPFFLFFHLMDPHYPYATGPFFESGSPRVMQSLVSGNNLQSILGNAMGRWFFPDPPWDKGELDKNRLLKSYDGEISRTDAAIREIVGSVLKAGDPDNTLIIVTADHGEEFNEHGGFGHMTSVFQEEVRVPLVVLGGRVPQPGKAVSCPVSSLDIAPTILESAGLEGMPDARGQSLWPLIRGGECEARPLVSELDLRVTGGPLLNSVLVGDMKMIRVEGSKGESWLVYDIEADPMESHDLFSRKAGEWEEFKSLLEGVDRVRDERLGGRESKPLMDDQKRILKSLGYLE